MTGDEWDQTVERDASPAGRDDAGEFVDAGNELLSPQGGSTPGPAPSAPSSDLLHALPLVELRPAVIGFGTSSPGASNAWREG